MANFKAEIHSFSDADMFAQGKTRKIGHNTWVVPVFASEHSKRPSEYRITYHGHAIVRYGRMAYTLEGVDAGHALRGERYHAIMDPCGWHTVTTVDRLNAFMPVALGSRGRFGHKQDGRTMFHGRDGYSTSVERVMVRTDGTVYGVTDAGRTLKLEVGSEY